MQKAPVKEIPGVTPWHGHVWKCFHSAWQQAFQKVKWNSSCSKNKTARNLGVLLSESNCVLATDISKLEASFSQKTLFCSVLFKCCKMASVLELDCGLILDVFPHELSELTG